MLPPLKSPNPARGGAVASALAVVLLLGACACPVRADDAKPAPDELARGLTADVLREAGNGGLGEWTREVIDRALERAGEAAAGTAAGIGSGERAGQGASPAPLPAERHAAALAAGRANPGSASGAGTAEILVFTSLSVPAASWRQWARDAARTGAPLVLRGVGEGGLSGTAKRIGERLGGAEAGVAVDPRLFRLFGIARVPAVVVVPGGVPPCRSRGCANDPAPPHDVVTGNIGLAAALEAVADEGAAGRNAARDHLRGLRGEDRR